MKGNPPVLYLILVEDLLVQSASNGAVQTYIITPKQYWGMGVNLAEFLAGLRIRTLTDANAGAGVTVKWEYSLDGKTWKTGSTVITEKTAVDDYTGIHNANSEQTPFVRLKIEVRDTAAAAQKAALISVFAYYKFRT
jgi:hypothetical protein